MSSCGTCRDDTMTDGCCGPGFGRRYHSKQEKTEWLQRYADQLEKELVAVKERMAQLAA